MREQLLAALKRPVKGPFDVTGLGKVWLKEMNVSEYLAMTAGPASGAARVLPYVLCDEQGNRTLSADDIPALADGRLELVETLFTLAMDNGVLPSLGDAKGN